jgi:hypothetical protein
MKLKEAIEKLQTRYGTTYYSDVESAIEGGKMGRWESILGDGDPLAITHAVNEVPRVEVASLLKKLSKPRYKKLPGTEIAISKLKWRRGH